MDLCMYVYLSMYTLVGLFLTWFRIRLTNAKNCTDTRRKCGKERNSHILDHDQCSSKHINDWKF